MDQAEILRRWVRRKEQGFDLNVATVPQEVILGKTTTIGVLGLEEEMLQNSNLLANVAVALSKHKKRVLIVDAHKGKIDPSIPLGIFPTHTLEDLLVKRTNARDTVYLGAHDVKFVKACDTLSRLDRLDVNAKNNFFREWALFEEDSDVIFINDTEPSPILNFSHLLVVTSMGPEALTAVYDKLRRFVRNDIQESRIMLVVNMCTTETQGKLVAKKFITTANKFLNLTVQELGQVVLEPEVIRALKARTTFVTKYPYLRSTHNVNVVVDNLLRTIAADE